ncbi:hypothetical protein BJF78_02610 [Pseudonocardia sp. CNS-139]|nr:hypothetical protein BJF78_02610 [Pseudonocardia sp. CNS-139]
MGARGSALANGNGFHGTGLDGTLATRPAAAPPDHDALVVVTEQPDVPGWVADWCEGTGRPVRLQPAPGAPEERIRTVAGLAGCSVLVLRTGPAAPAGPPGPSHRGKVVAAVRDLAVDGHVLAEAAEAAGRLDASLVLAHGVPLSFGERSVGLPDAVERGHRVLAAAADRVTSAYPGCTVTTRLLRLRPHELVGEALDADLLVLGGSRRRLPARLGLVASSALQHAPCPVLFAPRPA